MPQYSVILVKDNAPWMGYRDLSLADVANNANSSQASGYLASSIMGQEITGALAYSVVFSARSINTLLNYGMSESQYIDALGSHSTDGYRPIWINVCIAGGALNFATVFVQDDVSWQAKHGVDRGQFHPLAADLQNNGFRALCICGYGVGDGARFASIWVNDGVQPSDWGADWDMDSQGLSDTANMLVQQGFGPISVSSYIGSAGQVLYALVWQRLSIPWELHNGLSDVQIDQMIADFTSQGYRVACISPCDLA